MSALRAVVFDLDGTLIDSVLDIVAAANHTLRGAGLPERSIEQVRGFVGDGARNLLARAAELPDEDPRLDALLERFLDYYTAHPTTHTRLLPGAEHAMSSLGLPIALCTNKPRRTTDSVLAGLKLEGAFQVTVAAGDLAHNKPHPEPLLHIAAALGVRPDELVLVGDGPQDIECARAAGARSIGVENGIAPLERLHAARPDLLIPSLLELPAALASFR